MIEWSKENIRKLIDCYREKEILWDPKHKDFKDRYRKQEAWVELASDLDGDVGEVEKKVRMLVGQFQREMKKGKSADAVYKTRWAYFNMLLFLKDKHSPRHQQEYGIQETQDQSQDSHLTCETECSIEIKYQPPTSGDDQNIPQPPQVKRAKKRSREDNMDQESFDVMKTLGSNMKTRDEFDLFGEQVAVALRKIKNKFLLADTKFNINSILYQVERQELQSPSENAFVSSGGSSPFH